PASVAMLRRCTSNWHVRNGRLAAHGRCLHRSGPWAGERETDRRHFQYGTGAANCDLRQDRLWRRLTIQYCERTQRRGHGAGGVTLEILTLLKPEFSDDCERLRRHVKYN